MLRIKFQALPFDWAPRKGAGKGVTIWALRRRLLNIFACVQRTPPPKGICPCHPSPGMPLSGKNTDLAFSSTLIAVSLCEFGQATNPIGPDFLTQIIPEVPERGSPALDQSKKTAKFLKQTALRSHL